MIIFNEKKNNHMASLNNTNILGVIIINIITIVVVVVFVDKIILFVTVYL